MKRTYVTDMLGVIDSSLQFRLSMAIYWMKLAGRYEHVRELAQCQVSALWSCEVFRYDINEHVWVDLSQAHVAN